MATTTNYAWETPDDTDLVKDGAAAIRTLGSSIDTTTKALNPSTTLGDIEYRSSTANTNTRLGIGTTGQVLTVAGGVPSWATPASAVTFSGVRLQNTSAQTVSSGAWTTLTFNTETYDTDAFHSTSTNTSRVTIPSGKAGYYMVQAQAMDNGESGGRRLIRVMKNGTADFAIEGIPGLSADPSSASLQTVINLAVGDYLEIAWYQNWSGGNMTVLGNGDPGNPMFAVTYLGA